MGKSTTINSLSGMRLKEWREKRGFTQNELAEKSNYSITQISYIENGKRGMSRDAARIFSELLGIRENYLLGIDDFADIDDYVLFLKNTNRENDSIIEILSEYGYFIDGFLSDDILEQYDAGKEDELKIVEVEKYLILENNVVDGKCWRCSGTQMDEYLEDVRSYMVFKLKHLLSKCERATAEEKEDQMDSYREYFEDLKKEQVFSIKRPNTFDKTLAKL